MTRGFLPLLAFVIAAGTGALSWATDGFHVVTSEGARRLAVESNPRLLPDVALVDQNGDAFSFADYRGRILVVDLIYANCPTICGVLGDDFRGLLGIARGDLVDIDLLSVSFDPSHDDRQVLQRYASRYGATAPRWRIAAPVGQGGLATLLRSLGAVVIPDGYGGFLHTSGVYVIDPRGRLARILDLAQPSALAAAVREVAQ